MTKNNSSKPSNEVQPAVEEDKRVKILDAATKVLASKGFHNTKIKDIAQEAGVADGTIYLYFQNKEHLLIELFEDVMRKVLHIFDKALRDLSDPRAQFKQFIQTHLMMVKENPDFARIITIVLRQSSNFLKEYKNPLFGKYLQILSQILEEGQKQGIFKANLQMQIVNRAVFGALDELALAWLLSNKKEISLNDSAETMTMILLHGLESSELSL